jgi:dolichol-phosphate mannosyltransferase
MRVIIIIPTYNEADSTPKMIDVLATIVPTIKEHDMQVLYVDDSSPDGTAEIVKQKMKQYPWLHLLINSKKDGLGAAYAVGMKHAMTELKADYLMEFDADFQHPPQDIPRLVAEINNGYDYIVASRYINGGSIPQTWGFNRKFLSIVGNMVARILLMVPKIHDMTGGFKLSRVKGFMDEFDFSKLLSKRFAYKIHLFFYMLQKKAKVKEVPFAFAPRSEGESKIIKNEMQETLRVIFLLQLHNPKIQRIFKFGVVGGTGLVMQTLIFEILGVRLKVLSPSVAGMVGGEVAIISNFIFNNLWTFKEYAVTGIKMLVKFLQFNLTSFISLFLIQYPVLRLGEYVANGNDVIIRIFFFSALVVVILFNFFVYNKFIWKTTAKTKLK